MPDARIFQPARTAIQSGRAKTRFWLLEMEPRSRKDPDRLIGWVGSDDTTQQISLKFETKEAAIAYAERNGLTYQVDDPHKRIVKPKSYADNFIRRF
ncbi:MAG TPA: ETC complex I subunit [Geminicoccus sp.]|uniref:ETC complex I subunit n=1 Tax=Geminicoccus sp. TaxID=2024832 RepID=UPI002E369449|nr:ETC complex I subunit [Geminicoccus sp.]HEX2528296.1 ETC complex I subunit [Geminicoccus sp.]